MITSRITEFHNAHTSSLALSIADKEWRATRKLAPNSIARASPTVTTPELQLN